MPDANGRILGIAVPNLPTSMQRCERTEAIRCGPMPDPLEINADDSTQPSVRLSLEQRQALATLASEFDGDVGLLDAGDGYVKATFHRDGEQVGKDLLKPLYGDSIRALEPFQEKP